METEQRLKRLCAIGAPSGFEGPAVEAAKALLDPLMDEVWIDRLGNLIGVRRCGKPGAKKLLLDAHLDEVGLTVTGMEQGFLRFAAIGVDARMLPDREVTVLADPPLRGVVACLPPHVLSAEDREKAPKVEELFIDVGLSQEEAERRIPLGTTVVYHSNFLRLGERQLCSKSMDDRACFEALLRTAELLQGRELDVDLYVLGSTREEVGGMGAKVVTQAIAPDCCVAVDVTFGVPPDGAPPSGRGGAGKDPRPEGGHGGQQRHQRLGDADLQRGGGHRGGVHPAEVYAHPGGDGGAGRH